MTEILRNGKHLEQSARNRHWLRLPNRSALESGKRSLSVERIRPLVMKARGHLRELKCINVKLDHADGRYGLTELAPFDGIMVTAAASHIPQDLLEQLAIGGRLVIPVGTMSKVYNWLNA